VENDLHRMISDWKLKRKILLALWSERKGGGSSKGHCEIESLPRENEGAGEIRLVRFLLFGKE